MTGKFEIWWDSGAYYNGDLANSKLCGKGFMTFTTGKIRRIEGQWDNNKMTKCDLITMDDESTATNYQPETGLLVGEGKVKSGDSLYEGTWDDNGCLTGIATITNKDGSKFTG